MISIMACKVKNNDGIVECWKNGIMEGRRTILLKYEYLPSPFASDSVGGRRIDVACNVSTAYDFEKWVPISCRVCYAPHIINY